MIFMDMVCFKEVQFEYRDGFANDFGRMKIKGAVNIPGVFRNGGFIAAVIAAQ